MMDKKITVYCPKCGEDVTIEVVTFKWIACPNVCGVHFRIKIEVEDTEGR